MSARRITMSDTYARIEFAIRFIDEHAADQPQLADVARAVGLSTSHFQRLFRQWAGISPKRFLQFITAEHAKHLLEGTGSLLSVTYAAGLSSPSRLHDLLVNVHATTPGEYRDGGFGVRIRFGICESPFGDCLIASTDKGICTLGFLQGDQDRERALTDLGQRWPNADLTECPEHASRVAQTIFAKRNEGGSRSVMHLHLLGTNFQLRVWEALLRVPAGAVATYGDIARGIGAPGSARAVGGAIARNPVAFLIPCHRVIRSTGSFGNYRWGRERKRAMLAMEVLSVEKGEASNGQRKGRLQFKAADDAALRRQS